MAEPESSQNPANPSEIRIVWLNFSKSLSALLIPQADDRPLDQYLQLRDKVMDLVTSEDFLKQFEGAWSGPPPVNYIFDERIKAILLQEMKSFTPAAEIATATASEGEKKSWWRSMLGRGSTTIGSIKDLMENMPPLVKGGLTVLKELIDIFKEK